MLPLPQGFYPNYPLETDWAAVLLGLSILVALSIGLYYLGKYLRARSKKSTVVIAPEQSSSLWQETYQLFALDVPADIKKYYFETSEALTAYLGCAELTLSEISARNLAEATTLLQALTLADMVKFAKYIPTPEQTEQYRQQAITVLKAHKPAEEPHV